MPTSMAFVAPLLLAAAVPQAAPEPPTASEAIAAEDAWIVEWSLGTVGFSGVAAVPTQGRTLWNAIADAFRAEPAEQVRIEQRMTIRIAPLGAQRQMLADLPRAPLASRFDERKIGKCVPISGIAGVQIGGDNRLMLFMRDQRMIGASLEKSCRARDFYSGFYVERNGDGRLCVDRDMIHSRSGASCSVSRLRQLVAVDD